MDYASHYPDTSRLKQRQQSKSKSWKGGSAWKVLDTQPLTIFCNPEHHCKLFLGLRRSIKCQLADHAASMEAFSWAHKTAKLHEASHAQLAAGCQLHPYF
eukprot:2257684-Amphidinium_carterae.1